LTVATWSGAARIVLDRIRNGTSSTWGIRWVTFEENKIWNKIGGHGIFDSWNDSNLYINRDIVSDNGCLYVSDGGTRNEEEFGEIWTYNGRIWRPYSPVLSGASTRLPETKSSRQRLVKGIEGTVLCYIDEERINLVRHQIGNNDFKLINIPRTLGQSRLTTYGVNSFALSGQASYFGGQRQGDGLPFVIRSNGEEHGNLTADQIPGSRKFLESNHTPYIILPFEHEILVGCYNFHHPSQTASVWHFSKKQGWRLIGGFGHLNSWGPGEAHSVLSMTFHETNLYVTLVRTRGTPSEFSSVWKFDGKSWWPIMGETGEKCLEHAYHYNASHVHEGKVLVATGTALPPNRGLNTTGIWKFQHQDGKWDRLFDPLELGLSDRNSILNSENGKYIYSIASHQKSLIIGTSSTRLDGQPAIWQLADNFGSRMA
jgi:hypothetical protein